METKSLMKHLLALFAALSIILMVGCKDSTIEPESTEPNTDKEAMQKIADEDSSVSSFEPNYNEEDLMDFLGKTETVIYPFRVGHRVRLVSRNFNVNIVGDTAWATYTKTFEGTLLIAASYDPNATEPDTVVKKPFNSVVTRNLIFIKVANTDRPFRNWKLAAISLPEGGTLSPNIDITKLTIFLPGGDTLVITSPNNYYLSRGFGWWKHLPIISKNEDVTLELELFSAYADTDFVTLTYGADKLGLHRAKRKFELISSVPSGTGYVKVYQQTYRTHQWWGFYHAIVNAFPRQVIFDDTAAVENEMWGVPYFVKF